MPVAKPGGGAAAPEAGFSQLSPVPLATSSATAFSLRSPAFTAGAALPSDFSCDGAGQSPPLVWMGAPAGTRAYALVAEDTDVSLTEWVAYNVPLSVTGLDAGMGARPLLANGAQQGTNGRGTVGYDPACPNHGDPPHHYVFVVSAVDDFITMQTGADAAEVKSALSGHVLAQAQLTATFQR